MSRSGGGHLQVDLDQMRQQSVAQLRLEPRRLRRHDAAGIAYLHQVVHADGIQRERNGIFAGVDQLLERRSAASTADEINSLVVPDIADAEQWTEDFLLEAI